MRLVLWHVRVFTRLIPPSKQLFADPGPSPFRPAHHIPPQTKRVAPRRRRLPDGLAHEVRPRATTSERYVREAYGREEAGPPDRSEHGADG